MCSYLTYILYGSPVCNTDVGKNTGICQLHFEMYEIMIKYYFHEFIINLNYRFLVKEELKFLLLSLDIIFHEPAPTY